MPHTAGFLKRQARKRKAQQPYNPLSLHPFKYYQDQAKHQAQADTNAALSALPSAGAITSGASALSALLSQNQARQASLGSSANKMYGDAFTAASPTASAAAIGAGGSAPQVNTGAQGLVAAMGANQAQALGGGINASILRGQQSVRDLGGQRRAITAGQTSLYDKYLQAGKDEALQAAETNINNMLSGQSLGVRQSAIDATLRGQDLTASQHAKDRAERAREADSRIQQQALDRAARILVSAGSKSKNRNSSLVNASQSIIDRYMATKPADGLVLQNHTWVQWTPDMSIPYNQILRYLTAQRVRPNSAKRIAQTITGYTPPSWSSH